jgi:hypothetical protein
MRLCARGFNRYGQRYLTHDHGHPEYGDLVGGRCTVDGRVDRYLQKTTKWPSCQVAEVRRDADLRLVYHPHLRFRGLGLSPDMAVSFQRCHRSDTAVFSLPANNWLWLVLACWLILRAAMNCSASTG